MKKPILSEEFRRMRTLAGIINENIDNNLENKIKQWVDDNAGGYGPEETDPNYPKFVKEMNLLLYNTLEDFNPDYYGDDTTMSPDDILEDFIEEAINIIGKYTMGNYGDSTSFSIGDITDDFYEFMGVDPITESNILDQDFKVLKNQQDILKKVTKFYIEKATKLGVDRKLIGDFNAAINALEDAIFKGDYNK
jgi:hypothetical protein